MAGKRRQRRQGTKEERESLIKNKSGYQRFGAHFYLQKAVTA